MTTPTYSASNYLLEDYGHTLFPLVTTSFLVETFSAELKEFIDTKLLDSSVHDIHFLPQQRCYAAKGGFHLRRTVKLDPVAEFFIYDLVYRNRQSFRRDHRDNRRSFGYRFLRGKPQSSAEAYAAFKTAVAEAKSRYEFTLTVDVATYFNSIYHHDLVGSLRGTWPDVDVEALGIFLREINVGRSIDCLPHGLHPCKALGAEFLRFIDNSYLIQSPLLLRFMDDVHAFSDSRDGLTADLLRIQELLGERGLSLNIAKTFEGPVQSQDIATTVDAMKAELLRLRRRILITEDYEADLVEDYEKKPLSQEQLAYLVGLISSADVEESDAELVLALLRDHGEEVLDHMLIVLKRFPGLTKSIYNYSRFTEDRQGLDDLILKFLDDSPLATEYQLFWLSKLAEDFLSDSSKYGDILIKALEHTNATTISRAKVLEIPDRRFGLPELREERLRAGRSDWEAWSSAAGLREDPRAARNHLLGYFANASAINHFIADCIIKV